MVRTSIAVADCVAHEAGVAHRGPHPDLLEDPVVPTGCAISLGDLGSRDRSCLRRRIALRRAGLLASRAGLSPSSQRDRPCCASPRSSPPGSAERRSEHFSMIAARPDGHVGIQGEVLVLVLARVLEPVEAPHLVGTVVHAVARPHATVVGLLVHAPRRCGRWRGPGRPSRTGRCRSGGTSSAGASHRAGRRPSAGVVAIDAQPVHVAVPAHLVLAHHRHVVLDLACDDAGRTTGAGR